MNHFLHTLFITFATLAPAFAFSGIGISPTQKPVEHSKHHHHKSKSSSSSSNHCRPPYLPNAKTIQSPAYISSTTGRPVMQVAVINRTSLVSQSLLNKVLKTISMQVCEDFAPFYGIYVKFKVFPDQTTVDWSRFVPLIIDDLLPTDCDCISFHALNTNDLNGFPIGDAVNNPPPIPVGTPYIVIPMGDASTDYGVVPTSLAGYPYLPQSFDGLFCQTTSHEVLETLHNYSTNLYTLSYAGTTDITNINAFSNEVCDPFQYSPGYRLCDLNVANFALPSFWVNDLATGPYDFLSTTSAPFTPFAGEIDSIQFGPCGAESYTIISLPTSLGNPSMLELVDNGPIFSPCTCGSDKLVTSIKPKASAKRLRTFKIIKRDE